MSPGLGHAGVRLRVALSGRFSTPQPVVALSVFPPAGTTFPPTGSWPRVSPEGQTLAFVAVSLKGQQQLWLRRLNATTARAIPGTDGALRPFWAPNSQTIGFFANGELRRVDLDTGSIGVALRLRRSHDRDKQAHTAADQHQPNHLHLPATHQLSAEHVHRIDARCAQRRHPRRHTGDDKKHHRSDGQRCRIARTHSVQQRLERSSEHQR